MAFAIKICTNEHWQIEEIQKGALIIYKKEDEASNSDKEEDNN